MKTKRLKTTSNAKAQVPAEATNLHTEKCVSCNKVRMIVYDIVDNQEREWTIKTCDYCPFKNRSFKKQRDA